MYIPKNKDSQYVQTKYSNEKKSQVKSLLDVPLKHFIQGLSIKNNYPKPSTNVNTLLSSELPKVESNKWIKLSNQKDFQNDLDIINQKLLRSEIKKDINKGVLKIPNLTSNNSFITKKLNNEYNKDNKKETNNTSRSENKIYNILSGSGSDWIPRRNRQNLLNHSSVLYSILCPSNMSINKTKEQIISESHNKYNPTFIQKSISEFVELSQTFKDHKNPIFKEAYNLNENAFKLKSDICNDYYKKYKSYEGLTLKPFTKNKFI